MYKSQRPFGLVSPLSVALCAALFGLPSRALAQQEVTTATAQNKGTIVPAFEEQVAALTGKSGGLTSQQVAARVLEKNPDLAAKRAEVAQAARQVDQSIADFLPKLSLTAKYARLNPIEGEPMGPFVVAPGASDGPVPAGSTLVAQSLSMESIDNQFTFQAALNVPVSDYALRFVQRKATADHSHRASQLSLDASVRRKALEGRVAYYNWVRAELSRVVAEQSLGLAQEQLERVKVFAEADMATFADESSAVALVASSKLLSVRANNLASLQRTQLEVAMQLEPNAGAGFRIGESFGGPSSRPKSIDAPRALVREALSARPELAAQDQKLKGLEAQADVARAQAFPRLDAFASVAALNPDQRAFPATDTFRTSWQLGLQLSYSPNDTALGVLGAQGVSHQVEGAQAQLASLEDAIENEVHEARLGYLDAEAAVDSSAVALAAAEEAYRARRALFVNDRATSVELTQAHADLLKARMDAVSSWVGLRIARASLEYALGRDATR